jgi:hypothetical protein
MLTLRGIGLTLAQAPRSAKVFQGVDVLSPINKNDLTRADGAQHVTSALPS